MSMGCWGGVGGGDGDADANGDDEIHRPLQISKCCGMLWHDSNLRPRLPKNRCCRMLWHAAAYFNHLCFVAALTALTNDLSAKKTLHSHYQVCFAVRYDCQSKHPYILESSWEEDFQDPPQC